MPTEPQSDQVFESIQPAEEPPTGEEKQLVLGGRKIKLKLVLALAGGFLALMVVLGVLAGQKPPSVALPTPTPTPTPTPYEEVITSPSAYATDSAILRIEGEIQLLQEKLDATDLKEVSLNPPVLDMEVNFED